MMENGINDGNADVGDSNTEDAGEKTNDEGFGIEDVGDIAL